MKKQNEMRRQIVGPCIESELNEIRTGLVKLGEKAERLAMFNQCQMVYFEEYNSEWCTGDSQEPTITAADFIKTYLKP